MKSPSIYNRRWNTSSNVKKRIKLIIERLIKQANGYNLGNKFISIMWSSNRSPEILIDCSTHDFLNFAYLGTDQQRNSSEWWRNDRALLIILGLLIDQREQTNGYRHLKCVVKLFHHNLNNNLQEFDRLWDNFKARKIISEQPIIHNLPPLAFNKFIGYESELTQLKDKLITTNGPQIISIIGIGGSGKTTLALKTANYFLETNTAVFKAIIFTSAKLEGYLPEGNISRLIAENNLMDILQKIIEVIAHLEVIPVDLASRLKIAFDALKDQPTLLIIDNIETIENITSLLGFIQDLPKTVRLILTSRVRLSLGEQIFLSGLKDQDSLQLIKEIASQKQMAIDEQKINLIHDRSSGIPLVIHYIVGKAFIENKFNYDDLNQYSSADWDLAEYCFGELLATIRGQNSYYLMLALACFNHPAPRDVLIYMVDFEQYPIESLVSLDKLNFLSLITQPQEDTYYIHSLTRQYLLREIARDEHIKTQLLERKLAWYINVYTAPYGLFLWKDWQDYRSLDRQWLNIKELVSYCMHTNKLTEFLKLWTNLRGFSLLRGYYTERNQWMDWLITQGEKYQDSLILAQGFLGKSEISGYIEDINVNHLDLALKAWNHIKKVDGNNVLKVEISIYISALYLRQKVPNFSHSNHWLKISKTIIKESLESNPFYLSQIYYYDAEAYRKQKNFAKAQLSYQRSIDLGIEAKFNKIQIYASGWLGLIQMMEGNLIDAEKILKEGLFLAIQYEDRRSIAQFQIYLARLANQQHNMNNLYYWATVAKKSCDRLLIREESAEMENLLKCQL